MTWSKLLMIIKNWRKLANFNYILIKLRHYEKATKFEKISHLFWQNSCFYTVTSKQVEDFFSNFCGPLRKAELYRKYLHGWKNLKTIVGWKLFFHKTTKKCSESSYLYHRKILFAKFITKLGVQIIFKSINILLDRMKNTIWWAHYESWFQQFFSSVSVMILKTVQNCHKFVLD